MKEASKKPTGRTQSTLDGTFEKKAEAKVFTREAATHAIAQFVACDDQVCAHRAVWWWNWTLT